MGPSDIDSKLSSKTPAKRGRRKSITLEEVVEENEDKVSETLDVIKEDEEEKNVLEEKTKKSENIENKAVESEGMDISESKPEEKSDSNIPSVAKCEDLLQESIALLKNNTE